MIEVSVAHADEASCSVTGITVSTTGLADPIIIIVTHRTTCATISLISHELTLASLASFVGSITGGT